MSNPPYSTPSLPPILPIPGRNVSGLTPTGYTEWAPGEEEEGGYSTGEQVVIGTILASIVLVAISGNLLVCIAVLTDHRLKQNTNFFLVSLAVADMLVSVVVMTFAIVNDVHGTWLFGAAYCRIWISADVMCSTASILNLCVISVDRYMHIKDPLHYETWMTTTRIAMLIGAVWGISVFISFPPIHLGWHESLDGHSNSELCILELNPVYAVVSSSISFYIPCIIMIFLYVHLYACARRQAQAISRTQGAIRSPSRNRVAKYAKRDYKAAVTLGVIMGTFLVCWVPFFVINPIASLCHRCTSRLVYLIVTWLGYFNSCLNPIIYSLFNREFQRAFRRILCPRRLLGSRNRTLSSSFYSASSRASSYNASLVRSSKRHSEQQEKVLCQQSRSLVVSNLGGLSDEQENAVFQQSHSLVESAILAARQSVQEKAFCPQSPSLDVSSPGLSGEQEKVLCQGSRLIVVTQSGLSDEQEKVLRQ